MKFQKLIKTNTWLSVQIILLTLYPDQKELVNEYKKVFEKLNYMTPTETDVKLHITNVIDDFDNEEYVDVSGYKEKEGIDYAIEFTPWSEWLDMDVHENTLNNFTELEIIAHALYEMTYVSFDEEKIQKEIEKIHKIAKEIKKNLDENKIS